jgi:hypothetical protein
VQPPAPTPEPVPGSDAVPERSTAEVQSVPPAANGPFGG